MCTTKNGRVPTNVLVQTVTKLLIQFGLPQYSFVIRVKSQKAYHKCTEKGSNLTLAETLNIVPAEDLTNHQVDSFKTLQTT